MIAQIFRNSETNTPEQGESAKLIKSLGLEGQKRLSPDDKGTPGPYGKFRRTTQEQAAILSILCPLVVDVELFDHAVIPDEILREIQAVRVHRQDLKWIGVQHADVPELGYFLLAAVNGYTQNRYLLAHWGSHLVDWDQMETAAKSAWLDKTEREITAARVALERFERHSVAGLLPIGTPVPVKAA